MSKVKCRINSVLLFARYNTGENYIYRTKADVKAGAFAQIVWDDVKFLGCGTCRNTAKQLIIVVCRYRPRANIGDYSQHVRPPFENETNQVDVLLSLTTCYNLLFNCKQIKLRISFLQPKSYVFVKSECKNLIEKAESGNQLLFNYSTIVTPVS